MSRLLLRATLIVALALTASSAAQASPASDALGVACNAHPEFFDFTGIKLGENAEAHASVCGCLATEFSGLPDADVAILTKDVDGTATDADRTAHGNYQAVQTQARSTLMTCMQSAGLLEDIPGTNTGEPADMTKFSAACVGSARLLEALGPGSDAAGGRRDTFCGCLAEDLGSKITTADADILAEDLAGTATGESKAAYAGYAAASALAGRSFDFCMSQLAAAQ